MPLMLHDDHCKEVVISKRTWKLYEYEFENGFTLHIANEKGTVDFELCLAYGAKLVTYTDFGPSRSVDQVYKVNLALAEASSLNRKGKLPDDKEEKLWWQN